MRRALGACLTIELALAFATPSHAQTADGATPAEEDICTKWGMTGKVNGLCNAYCKAMDCDSAEPQASEQAYARVLGKIEDTLGDPPVPACEGDACEPVACPCAPTWENGIGGPDIRTQTGAQCFVDATTPFELRFLIPHSSSPKMGS